MTLNNKYINTLLIAISITLLFSACSYIPKTTEPSPELAPQETKTNTDTNSVANNSSEVAISSTATKTQTSEPIVVEHSKKTVSNKANIATLTDDQKAMSVDELLNDTDLIRPIIQDDKSNYSDVETAESDDAGDYEELYAPEEINFDDDFTIPEFAQKLLDESHPQYYPPTGKLFGFK